LLEFCADHSRLIGFSAAGIAFAGAVGCARAAILAGWGTSKKAADSPDYRLIAKKQAEAAERRVAKIDGGVRDIMHWVHTAAMHLLSIWPGMSYDDALREMKDYLEDAIRAWPSDAYEYSMRSAREMAEEYARDHGENYGKNS